MLAMPNDEDTSVTTDELDTVKDQAVQERLDLAARIGRYLTTSDSEADRRAALEISRVLASDVSEAVRKALVQEIRHCEFLPQDLIDQIIQDVDAVSVSFVKKSRTLNEEKLIRLVRLGNNALHLAIADRDHVSEPVGYALCEMAMEPAVTRLMENDGAEMSQRICFKVVDRFPDSENLLTIMNRRGDLPMEAAAILIRHLSQEAADAMVERFDLAPDLVSYIASSTRRKVMGQTLEEAPDILLERYMISLKQNQDLSSDMMLHQIRNGNVRSFVAAVAALAGQSMQNVRHQLDDQGVSALPNLLSDSGFGTSTIAMMAAAYKENSVAFGQFEA